MKHLILPAFVFVFLACIPYGTCNAQENRSSPSARAGIKGGLNFSNLNIQDANNVQALIGFNLGLFAKLPLASFIAIQPELSYTTTIHYPHHCDKKVVDCERITEASIGHTARIVVEHPSHHRTMAQSSWLNDEVFTANFGDKRLSNRFASIITAFAEKPNASIPQSAGSWKSSKATYNFFQTKK